MWSRFRVCTLFLVFEGCGFVCWCGMRSGICVFEGVYRRGVESGGLTLLYVLVKAVEDGSVTGSFGELGELITVVGVGSFGGWMPVKCARYSSTVVRQRPSMI